MDRSRSVPKKTTRTKNQLCRSPCFVLEASRQFKRAVLLDVMIVTE